MSAEQSKLRLVAYCMRCGGDCYDDGEKNYHRCPPKRPEAAAVVALKRECDNLQSIIERRFWAKTLALDDLNDLKAALVQMRSALSSTYPSA